MSQGDIRKPHLQQFYRNQQGRDYIEYPGLLAEFHAQNDAWMLKHPDEQDHRSIQSVIVQVPHVDNGNIAICTATVRMSSGATFTDVADASPNNVSKMLVNALLRMSSTRCKGRALRDATNIGTTMYEELPDAEPTEQDEGEPARDTEPTRGSNVREFNDTREPTERPTRASNYTPTGVHNPRPARQTSEPTNSGEAKASPYKPASANQLATIAKLSRLIGKPEEPREDMSSAEAADRITDLSREYNERRGSPVPSQRAAQAQERAGGATEAQLKAIWAMSRKAGTPEDPKPGDYTRQLASARIEELTSILDQGGQQ